MSAAGFKKNAVITICTGQGIQLVSFLALLGRLVRLALVSFLGLNFHKLSSGIVLDLLVAQDFFHDRLFSLSVGQTS